MLSKVTLCKQVSVPNCDKGSSGNSHARHRRGCGVCWAKNSDKRSFQGKSQMKGSSQKSGYSTLLSDVLKNRKAQSRDAMRESLATRRRKLLGRGTVWRADRDGVA